MLCVFARARVVDAVFTQIFLHGLLQIVAEGTVEEIFSQVEKFLDKK